MSEEHAKHVERSRVAGGAAVALVARLGAIIEAVSLVAFTWAYGSATLGLFAVLWSYIKVMSAVTECALPTVLQRLIPRQNEQEAARTVGAAIKISFLVATAFAAIGFLAAPWLASKVHASSDDTVHLTGIIRIYVWLLPFWTAVEVTTAAIRALRKFGPEIKVKIFYEQGFRLVLGIGFALIGWMSYGLFLAHILSALLSAWLAIRLVARHFPIREVLLAPLFSVTSRELLHYGLPIMPSNVTKFLVSELPVMTLNQLLPGAAGATASAYYSIARRLSSILQSVRMTFEYVIAPMASEKDDNGDRHLLQEMFAFATRLSFVFAILIFTTLVVARNDILAALRPDFIAASTTIVILCFGRVVEASTGPASAIIEMLAHRMLPVVNALIGLTAQIAISLWLIPQYGVTGAAIAAATGLNITAFLSALQSWRLFDIKPFSVEILRPMTIAVLLSGAFLTANEYLISLPPPFTLVIAIAFLIFSSIILVRFGFRADDAAALGPLGKLARPKARHRIKALKAAQKTGRNA